MGTIIPENLQQAGIEIREIDAGKGAVPYVPRIRCS
jgi:hypothetical protein